MLQAKCILEHNKPHTLINISIALITIDCYLTVLLNIIVQVFIVLLCSTPITFNNRIKTSFEIRNKLFQIKRTQH